MQKNTGTFILVGISLMSGYLLVNEEDQLDSNSSQNKINTNIPGAKGIWRFMLGTALKYGLKVNRYVDERMNIEKATGAAIKFLKNFYKNLGSWTLAAASYNMGLAQTKRTVEQQQNTKLLQFTHELRNNPLCF